MVELCFSFCVSWQFYLTSHLETFHIWGEKKKDSSLIMVVMIKPMQTEGELCSVNIRRKTIFPFTSEVICTNM